MLNIGSDGIQHSFYVWERNILDSTTKITELRSVLKILITHASRT